jgi:hypothetical protein
MHPGYFPMFAVAKTGPSQLVLWPAGRPTQLAAAGPAVLFHVLTASSFAKIRPMCLACIHCWLTNYPSPSPSLLSTTVTTHGPSSKSARQKTRYWLIFLIPTFPSFPWSFQPQPQLARRRCLPGASCHQQRLRLPCRLLCARQLLPLLHLSNHTAPFLQGATSPAASPQWPKAFHDYLVNCVEMRTVVGCFQLNLLAVGSRCHLKKVEHHKR